MKILKWIGEMTFMAIIPFGILLALLTWALIVIFVTCLGCNASYPEQDAYNWSDTQFIDAGPSDAIRLTEGTSTPDAATYDILYLTDGCDDYG